MIEKYVVTEGMYKGRLHEGEITEELAYIEDYWRKQLGDKIIPSKADKRPSQMVIAFRVLINDELKMLIAKRAANDINKEVDAIYNDSDYFDFNDTTDDPSVG